MEIRIDELETIIQRRVTIRRNIILATFAIIILTGLIVGLFRQDLFNSYAKPTTGVIVAYTLGAAFTFTATFYITFSVGQESRELENLRSRYRIVRKLSPEFGKGRVENTISYFDRLVQINVTNLADYYTLVKVHTENSFRVTLVAGSLGFVLIFIGLIIGFNNDGHIQTIAFITSGSGVLIEFISGIFFYLYNRTVSQLKLYHDSLITVQNILLSFKIIGEFSDEKDKVSIMSEIISSLIGNRGEISNQDSDDA